jgi:hypothetical protein
MKNIKSDVVFIWPEWKEEPSESFEFEGFFREDIRLLMEKALSIAQNFVLLLRPNFEVAKLIEVLSGILTNNKNSSCSVELEKIYFHGKATVRSSLLRSTCKPPIEVE